MRGGGGVIKGFNMILCKHYEVAINRGPSKMRSFILARTLQESSDPISLLDLNA